MELKSQEDDALHNVPLPSLTTVVTGQVQVGQLALSTLKTGDWMIGLPVVFSIPMSELILYQTVLNNLPVDYYINVLVPLQDS